VDLLILENGLLLRTVAYCLACCDAHCESRQLVVNLSRSRAPTVFARRIFSAPTDSVCSLPTEPMYGLRRDLHVLPTDPLMTLPCEWHVRCLLAPAGCLLNQRVCCLLAVMLPTEPPQPAS
jgi:hypothetical protein